MQIHWKSRSIYFCIIDTGDAKKKTALSLTVIGSETSSLLRKLLAPVSPSIKTAEKLSEILKKRLKPQPIVIAER